MSLRSVRRRIEAACARAGRDPADVTLVAVTKGQDLDTIRREVLDHGHVLLGENRVQEWRDKRDALAGDPDAPDVEWHFIGNLQTNKVKYLADIHTVHSLNRVKLANTMEKQGAKRGFRTRAMVELNVSGEASKEGAEVGDAERLVEHARGLEHVDVAGLMAMAPYSDDPEDARPTFRRLRQLGEKLGLHELSMGMSGDFEVAIEEGATIVRVGSAIFDASDG